MKPYPTLTPRQVNPRPIDDAMTIGHVHLKTAALQPIHDFYVGILGFDIVAELPSALFLSTGGYHHDLAFNTWDSEGGQRPAPGTTGLYHVALRFSTRKRLAEALQRLIDAKWPISGASDHGTHEAIYLDDPDGNGLELCWDRPVAEWPLDKQGHLQAVSDYPDLKGLLAELDR